MAVLALQVLLVPEMDSQAHWREVDLPMVNDYELEPAEMDLGQLSAGLDHETVHCR